MRRASLSSLVISESGQKLLVIHLLCLGWIAITWIGILIWLCRGAFNYRKEAIKLAADEINAHDYEQNGGKFRDEGRDGHVREGDMKNRGWRLRTVMVTNIPVNLRNDHTLKEYFEFYMAHKISEPPPVPGLIHGLVSFLSRFSQTRNYKRGARSSSEESEAPMSTLNDKRHTPLIEKVVIVRKMTEWWNGRRQRNDAKGKGVKPIKEDPSSTRWH
jgi:hypothetical protein